MYWEILTHPVLFHVHWPPPIWPGFLCTCCQSLSSFGITPASALSHTSPLSSMIAHWHFFPAKDLPWWILLFISPTKLPPLFLPLPAYRPTFLFPLPIFLTPPPRLLKSPSEQLSLKTLPEAQRPNMPHCSLCEGESVVCQPPLPTLFPF